MEKSNSFIIDSSVLVAFYDVDDTQHQKAVEAANEVINKTVYLHPYILQETITVLTYKFGSDGAKKFLDNIKNADNIHTDIWLDTDNEIIYFNRLNKKISFADSCIIKMSEERNIPILTFDKQIISILNNINF